MADENQQNNKIQLLNIDSLNNTYQLLTVMLDKATQKGIYTLEETFKISIALNNINKTIATLDICQKVLAKNNDKII